MKKIALIIFLISFTLIGCKKQTIDLDAKVQETLAEIEAICQETNIVSALLIIDKKLNQKVCQGYFVQPNYMFSDVLSIVSNSYNNVDLDKELSNTNDIDILMARSIYFQFVGEKRNAFTNAYKAYLMNTNKIDTLEQTLYMMAGHSKKSNPLRKSLLQKYNLESTNESVKFWLNFDYNIDQKEYNKSLEILNQFQKNHPKYNSICNIKRLIQNLCTKKINSKESFNICLELYNNGYKDIWFDMYLGNLACRYKKYELAVEAYKISLELSEKYNENTDRALARCGYALKKCGRIEEAKSFLEKALKQNSTNKLAITVLEQME